VRGRTHFITRNGARPHAVLPLPVLAREAARCVASPDTGSGGTRLLLVVFGRMFGRMTWREVVQRNARNGCSMT
jgi:hypothetical protein